jgi:hypothetical protein
VAEEKVSLEMAIGRHVADHRLDSASTSQFAPDGGRQAALQSQGPSADGGSQYQYGVCEISLSLGAQHIRATVRIAA